MKPAFERNQKVRFIGGVGIIKGCITDSSSQLYIVEMDMGPAPAIGRVGNETTILLHASEIKSLA
uniref:Uncharacterized protein n=1 Tax=Cyanothece sp. (strain PCC 7425 / ATCC 29141) TaxID=395961 RepID=B8HNQ1_CYAP4